ncbi:MAG: DUF2066 domain-containing protein [Rhodospirillaceae bacterium]|nr:DUF2066 domain-containing protein [Rhodospirillaceae bacterium]
MIPRPVSSGKAVLIAVVLGVCAALAPAMAADESVYTVRDVAVDATAADAAAARESALAAGEREAFARLMRRLVPRAEIARLRRLSTAELKNLIRTFEVQEEKTSPVRYLAKLTVRFDVDGVRNLLRSTETSFAETVSKPLLVLPVFRDGGAVSLWDDPNPWRAAWSRLPASDGLVPIVLPAGDLIDIRDISADQAAAGNDQRIQTIARRYGSTGALVVVADLRSDIGGRLILQISVNRFGASVADRTTVQSVVGNPGEAADALLTRAAADIVAQIEDQWQSDNVLRFSSEQSVVVSVAIGTLADWIDIRNRLAGIVPVRRSHLVYLSKTEARLEILYLGDESQLRLAMAQRDLDLARDGTGWILRKTEGRPASVRP